MRAVSGALLIATVAHGAWLEYEHAPPSVYLPETAPTAPLTDVPLLIANQLGLTADKPSWWRGRGDLLSRPTAALLVNLQTPKNVPLSHSQYEYELRDNGSPLDMSAVESRLRRASDAGVKSTIVTVQSAEEISATGAASDFLANVGIADAPSVGNTLVDGELANLYRLHKWLASTAARNARVAAPELYTVNLQSFASTELSEMQLSKVTDMLKLIADDVNALHDGNAIIARVYSAADQNQPRASPDARLAVDNTVAHSRRKRAADADLTPPSTADVKFADPNYPAMFGIILVTGLLLFSVLLFLTHGMWTMEPDEDTIIYRMTRSKNKDI